MQVTGILDSIKESVTAMTGLDPSFVDDIDKRLQSLTYTLQKGEDWAVNFTIQSVTNTIKSNCNTTAIPEGLYNVAINMVCGEFLATKKALGQLSDAQMQSVIKSIEEGDTKITYADEKSLNSLFDTLVNNLRAGSASQFVRYRRLLW